MSKKPTIKDIAKLANVSPATVSGVLNNSGRQTPATVNLIHQIMADVGYIPRRNKLRAQNKKVRTKTKEVGLLFPDHDRASATTNLAQKLRIGIEKVLAEKGVYLRVIFLNEEGGIDKKDTKGLQGLLVRGPFDKGDVELNYKFPVISILIATVFLLK